MTFSSIRGIVADEPLPEPGVIAGKALRLDSYDTAPAERLLVLGRIRHLGEDNPRRLLTTEATAAALFLLAAGLLAGLGPQTRSLSISAVALTVVAYLIAERVRYPVGSAWTAPTQLVFVAMLFTLPPSLVPLVVAACSVADQAPSLMRGRVVLTRVYARVADAFYSLGPSLVFVLFTISGFSWARWPVFLLALAAQFAADASSGLARTWWAERVAPSGQLPMLWLYATDACLSCVGLLIAASAARDPGLVLLVLPLVGLLWLLARERAGRLDYALALSAAYRGTASLLSYVIAAGDPDANGHGPDVVDLSRSTADVLGLDMAERRVLEFVAMLHDVGKLSASQALLTKPGRLDDDEREAIRRQVSEGEQLLDRLGGAFASVGRCVRASHEHYDGRGYPDGLAGDGIPVQARIVSVCDAFSAMIHDRPYRTAMPIADALDELRRCAGSQFDPEVVSALERVVV